LWKSAGKSEATFITNFALGVNFRCYLNTHPSIHPHASNLVTFSPSVTLTSTFALPRLTVNVTS